LAENPRKLQWIRATTERWRLVLLLRLALPEEDLVDVRDDARGCDRDAREEVVQLLVVPDREHDVPRRDPGLLIVARGVARELEDLDRQLLEDRGHEDRRARADAVAVAALAQEAVETADGELEARLEERVFGEWRSPSTAVPAAVFLTPFLAGM